ncbi:MAG TPA: energy transducer TonB [Pyrinomonadaceae bacterium]|nr:energy transducer TonB [Pyrinomonadaceae bacterium]
MRNTILSLFAFLVILSVSSIARAQETKPAEQKPETPAAADTEKPKNEVERLIAEVGKKGDKVLGICIDPEVCKNGTSVEGLTLEPGAAVTLPVPAYPPIARAAHAQGSVEVQVLIDVDGKVIAAAAISGHPLLQVTSVKAARQAVFTPTKLEGTPVKVTGVIRYNFVTQ